MNHGFLVKAGNDDVCRLGPADDSPEIVFHKVIRMNSNRITNLPEIYHTKLRIKFM